MCSILRQGTGIRQKAIGKIDWGFENKQLENLTP
jgi:hypothetical protein